MKYEIIPLQKSVKISLKIPSSKSLTNRALILATLSKNKVKIKNLLLSDDTKAMFNCLKILKRKSKVFNLNVKLSGTTMRFILALSCLTLGKKKIYGEEALNKRPIKDLVDGLKQLGAKIDYLKNEGFPPVLVNSANLKDGTIKMKGDVSSQYISALLMISPVVGNIKIKVSGEQTSKPYIDMTIDLMKKFGVRVINKNYKEYFIPKQTLHIKEYSVEGDFSSAGYFFAAAALTGSTINLKNLNAKSKQADLRFVEILNKMGNKITYKKDEIRIEGSFIRALTVDMTDCPDQIPTLAVLASFAKGETKIIGIKSLRVKETDRVSAARAELLKMGIKTKEDLNTLTIFGGSPRGAEIDTYGDHRMAMSFSLAGLKIPGIVIKNPEVVSKTYPSFWKDFKKITRVRSI